VFYFIDYFYLHWDWYKIVDYPEGCRCNMAEFERWQKTVEFLYFG